MILRRLKAGRVWFIWGQPKGWPKLYTVPPWTVKWSLRMVCRRIREREWGQAYRHLKTAVWTCVRKMAPVVVTQKKKDMTDDLTTTQT